MRVFVYALVDPRTGRWHYVGRTMSPKTRLSSHLSNRHENLKKTELIDDLRGAGFVPTMLIVCECDGVLDAAKAEAGITAAARTRGEPLLNGKGDRAHVGGTGAMCATQMMPGKYRSVRDLQHQQAHHSAQ